MEMPGNPARLHVIVKISDRYIDKGSFDFLADSKGDCGTGGCQDQSQPVQMPFENPSG
jgi:hypothetical protein